MTKFYKSGVLPKNMFVFVPLTAVSIPQKSLGFSTTPGTKNVDKTPEGYIKALVSFNMTGANDFSDVVAQFNERVKTLKKGEPAPTYTDFMKAVILNRSFVDEAGQAGEVIPSTTQQILFNPVTGKIVSTKPVFNDSAALHNDIIRWNAKLSEYLAIPGTTEEEFVAKEGKRPELSSDDPVNTTRKHADILENALNENPQLKTNLESVIKSSWANYSRNQQYNTRGNQPKIDVPEEGDVNVFEG